MNLLELCINNMNNSEFFVNIFSSAQAIIIFLLIGLSIPIEFFMMLKSDCIDEVKDRKFRKYINGHSSGTYLRDIDIDKEYIILDDDFFDNISEHGGKRYKSNLDECKERFLIEYGYKYNIIIFSKSGYMGKKYSKILEYCTYNNLPVCRVIDYMPYGLIQERITLNDNNVIYYYKLD